MIKVPIKSGQKVKPDTVLMVLTNPDMELAANDLEWQVKQAEANYADLKVKLQSQTFDQQAAVATAESDLKQAELNKDKEEQLFKAQLETELNMKLAGEVGTGNHPLSDGKAEARHHEGIRGRAARIRRKSRWKSCGPPTSSKRSRWAISPSAPARTACQEMTLQVGSA